MERSFCLRFCPHALHCLHHVSLLGQKGVAELRDPTGILGQIGEHIGESD
jgi:hypothetical protein